MDETLKYKSEEFNKALKTLEESLAGNFRADKMIRDAAVKRFEYSAELCWKTIKVFLEIKFGEVLMSPKECFRALRKYELLSDAETEQLLKMVDDRNLAAHTYNEKFVDELSGRLADYYAVMRKVFEAINA